MKDNDKKLPLSERIQIFLYGSAFFMELIAALFVIVLIFFQFAGLAKDMVINSSELFVPEGLTRYLEVCLNIVIGIEFLKMLCRHNMDAVIEVLLFTLARHLIVTHCTMLESLICIIAIAILFCVRKFLFVPQVDKNWGERKEKDEEQGRDGGNAAADR